MRKIYLVISAVLMLAAALAFLTSNLVELYGGRRPGINADSSDISKYVCIETVIHTEVNKTAMVWFAQQCHSKNLKITWYVQPNILDAETAAVLMSFVGQGDAVELSFGPVFFNSLAPENRVQLVDMQMSAFRNLFGRDPTMVESYYVDAYTLNFLSLNYSSVKGGVVFVNHESYADDFKSAGAYYMPYYPSKHNTLTPGTGEDKTNFVALPFLQRDLGNCLLHNSNLYNLDPQDGTQKVPTWRSYFRNLLDAYLDGWQNYGLALYMIDLSYPIIPNGEIAEDLTDIGNEIVSSNCTNLLDSDFVSVFKSRFSESPEYKWIYTDPLSESFTNYWYFSPERRFGFAGSHLVDGKTYSHDYEPCYFRIVFPYDNSVA